MKHNNLKNMLREGVVKKSIQILRNRGKSDSEIKEMMLKDFAITEKNLDQIMKAKSKNKTKNRHFYGKGELFISERIFNILVKTPFSLTAYFLIPFCYRRIHICINGGQQLYFSRPLVLYAIAPLLF